MKPRQEAIALASGQSFRLLHWEKNLREVDSILASGARQRIRGAGERWHFHPEMELAVIAGGAGTRFLGDHIGSFEAPEIVLIGSNVPHFWKLPQASSGFALQWDFPGDHAFWRFPEAAGVRGLWREAAYGVRFFGGTATAVAASAQQMAAAGGLERLVLFLAILGRLARAPKREWARLSSRPFDLAAHREHQSTMSRVIAHILENYRDPIALTDMLRLACMSKATFSRHFPRNTGSPFSLFVNEVRLDAACRELATTQATVSEIAFNSGFNSISYFNRVFRSSRGCTPVDYRRRFG